MRDAGSRGALPTELTSFVGRDQELSILRDLISDHRFVMISGMSGIGKTRLALQFADSVQRAYQGGIVVISADTLTDRAQLIDRIAQELGTDEGDLPAIGRSLSGRTTLLVLDGLDDPSLRAGSMIEELARWAPGLRVLATSRRQTGIGGEATLLLGPLELPRATDDAASSALRLLLARAKETDHAFRAEAEDAAALRDICHALSGVPRALEAAARALRVLSPGELLAELESPEFVLEEFSPTGTWAVSTPDAFAASTADLSPRTRTFLGRLATFRGAFDLAFASELFGQAGSSAADIAALLDRSLLIREGEPGARSLFRMLEPYRRLARNLLDEEEQTSTTRVLHDALLGRLERAGERWFTSDQSEEIVFLNRYPIEVRDLLDSATDDAARAERAVAAIAAVPYYWQLRPVDPWPRARDWIASALRFEISPEIRRRALDADAYIAYIEGEVSGAAEALDESAALGPAMDGLGELVRAMLDIAAERLDDAEERLRAMISAAEQSGSIDDLGDRFWWLALVRVWLDDPQDALALAEAGAGLCSARGDVWGAAQLSWMRALALLRLGRPEDAAPVVAGVYDVESAVGDRVGQANCLRLMASIASARGDDAAAIELAAAIDPALPVYPHIPIEEVSPEVLDSLRERVGTPGVRGFSRRVGPARPTDLVTRRRPQETPGAAERPVLGPLSARERDIALLVAEGLGNPAIAARLVISRRTVEGHVQRILGKLGFRSRSQIAVWVTEHRPSEPGARIR